MNKKFFDALDNLLDRPIAFNPSFKKITGSTNAALLLSQAFYWTKRTTNIDGWFYKTRDEWMEETALTEEELDTARAKCRAVGVMEEKLKGVPATLHYRIIKPRVYELLGFQFGGSTQTGLPETPEIGGKPESGVYPDFNKESESTSGNTSVNEDAEDIKARTEILKKLYEQNVGPITPLMMNFLRNAAIDYPDQSWYAPAFAVMVSSAKHRNWSYVDTVLKGWKEHYFGWKPEFPEQRKGVKNDTKRSTKPRTSGPATLSPEGQRTADEINRRRAAKKAALPIVQ